MTDKPMEPLKICIVGAGAIGGFVAALMANTGHDVSVVARGDHLAAIRENGLTLEHDGREIVAKVAASDNPADLGEQDYVIVTLKAPSLPTVLPTLEPLLGPETPIITAMNGVPWWMFDGFGDHDGLTLNSVDGDGALAAYGNKERLIGCVLHIACDVPEPGRIRHNSQNRFIIGEPNGEISDRVTRLVDALVPAGVGAEATDEIQQEVWIKLLGNVQFAPVCMIVGATNDKLAADPATRQVMLTMWEEAAEVGRFFGLKPGMTGDQRIDLGGSLIGFKASTRQDYEKGRPVELDVIVNAIREMGDIAGVETPTIDTVFALAAQKAALAGLYSYKDDPVQRRNAA